MTSSEEDDIPQLGKYSILRKNFVKDIFLSTVFIVTFAITFMFGWDFWVDTASIQTQTPQLFQCTVLAVMIGVIVTVPLNLLINRLQSRLNERHWKKQIEHEE